MRRLALAFVLLTACQAAPERDRAAAGKTATTTRAATADRERVPPPPPPPPPPPLNPGGDPHAGDGVGHPLYRYPRKPHPYDPVRDPAVLPKLVTSRPPEYTPEARKASITGIVILEVIIERDGRISRGRVLKPLPFGLSRKAIDAVRGWRYSPARNERGVPVRCIRNVTVDFKPMATRSH